jgi:hypothetical protein
MDRPQPHITAPSNKFAKLTASGYHRQEPTSARVTTASHNKKLGGTSSQMRTRLELG